MGQGVRKLDQIALLSLGGICNIPLRHGGSGAMEIMQRPRPGLIIIFTYVGLY